MDIHVRFNGRSDTFDCGTFGISTITSDDEIKEKLAHYYDQEKDALDNLVIEHLANGNITVRPQAVYG